MSEVCNTNFEVIDWHYAVWKPDIEVPGIRFIQGLPDPDIESGPPKLVVVDDFMTESSKSSAITDLFTKGCHHKNISVFFITQNLFHSGKNQRDLSLNTHYLVLFKNPRDKAQIRHLAQQMYPSNSKFLTEAYLDATNRPHGYLFLDLKQQTSEDLRVKTNIFPDDGDTVVYIPRKQNR